MSNHPSESHIFFCWSDLNHKLLNDWLAFYSLPLQLDLLHSIYFAPAAAWNRWIDRIFRQEIPTIPSSIERTISSDPFYEATADALLADIQEAKKKSLPHHKEFDTLIYPWCEADLPVADSHKPTVPEVQKVA